MSLYDAVNMKTFSTGKSKMPPKTKLKPENNIELSECLLQNLKCIFQKPHQQNPLAHSMQNHIHTVPSGNLNTHGYSAMKRP